MYYYLRSLSSTSKENNIIPIEAKKDEPINILVMGVDVGTLGDTSKDNAQRTDTIILMNYNPKNKAINLISIPRDTLILIDGQKTKINAAHAIGTKSGSGVKYLIDAVEKILDIDINYYGKINYKGFIEIIDAIGGVDMDIKTAMDYDDASQNLHIHFKKGLTHLNGQKAMEFFRWRENNKFDPKNNGDLGRIENQHLFIAKLLEKIKSPAIVTKLPTIMQVIPKYAETNMSATDILSYGLIFAKTDSANIKTTVIKGEAKYIDGVSYFIYDEKKNSEINAILHPDGGVKSPEENITLNKSSLKIQVLNCTSKTGIATNYSTIISQKGYEHVEIGNSKKLLKSKIIIYGLDNKYDSIIKSEFGINNIERVMKKQGNFDIIVMLGEDYSDK